MVSYATYSVFGALGVRRGVLVVGIEGHHAAIDADVSAVVEFAQDLGLPVVLHDKRRSVLDICHQLSAIATHLVTNDTKLMQLATDRLSVVRPKSPNEHECLTPKEILSLIGVRPVEIPTFVALHHSEQACPKARPLPRNQAIRLVELYGDLDTIFANLDAIQAVGIRETLAAGRQEILHTYHSSKVDTSPVDFTLDFNRLEWRIDNEHAARALHAHRFHCLVRLLPLPDDVPLVVPVQPRETNAYKAVRDRESIAKTRGRSM